MMRKKRTEITIETDRIVLIKGRRPQARAWCMSCASQVSMVTVDEAASFAHVSSRAIYRWIEGGELHFIETADGRLVICLNSILSAATFEKHKENP